MAASNNNSSSKLWPVWPVCLQIYFIYVFCILYFVFGKTATIGELVSTTARSWRHTICVICSTIKMWQKLAMSCHVWFSESCILISYVFNGVLTSDWGLRVSGWASDDVLVSRLGIATCILVSCIPSPVLVSCVGIATCIPSPVLVLLVVYHLPSWYRYLYTCIRSPVLVSRVICSC